MKSTKANSSSTIYTEHMVDGALPSCAVTGTERGWGTLSRLGPSALTRGPHPSAAPTGCRSLGTQERTKWACPLATRMET